MLLLSLALSLSTPPAPAPAPAPSLPTIGEARIRALKVPATRIDDEAIVVDGRPSERAWLAVPTAPELVQVEPRFGHRPTHATEVRIAYGDRGLYAAFICHDDPGHVRRGVFRKDEIGATDHITLYVDPNNDDTNGYSFLLNPSGSQKDQQLFRDGASDLLWDGVWRGAAAVTDDGWSAELLIPWSTIRFDARGGEYTFGINVGRWIARDGEWQMLSPIPQGLPGWLSWSLDYTGVRGIEPGLNFEVRPYLSLRAAPRRPAESLDRGSPLLAGAGLDLKYAIKGNLTLDVAFNPDFGQAEVDPAVLNLGPFEVYFPERRTFFLESKELLETPFQLFYSRRIGRIPRASLAREAARGVDGGNDAELVALDPQTRIYGALRLTGQVAPGWSLGLLTATTGATFGTLRLPGGDERRITVDPLSNHAVVRLRREFASQTSVGVIITNVVRGSERLAFGAGFDYRLRFRERWNHAAQVIGTHNGERTGMGASATLSRGGRNLALGLDAETLTPHADFNDLGYMRLNDFISGRAKLGIFNAQPLPRARKLSATLASELATSYTYPRHPTKEQIRLDLALLTARLWPISAWTECMLPRYDLFETRGGIPYAVPLHWRTGGSASTPENRRVVALVSGAYGELGGRPGLEYGLALRLLLFSRLELALRGDGSIASGVPRWTTTSTAGEPVFGSADVAQYAATVRGTLGFLPNLTLQTYNQLYHLSARHDEFMILSAPDTLVPTDPAPYLGQVDQGLTTFVSSSILRWEYRPGAFLFLVYTHRSALGDGSPGFSYRPAGAVANLTAPGVAQEDVVFVKLQHMFGL